MRNQVQRDSSYPGERRVRVHRGVAQGRDSKKGKRNRIEKKTERQAAGQEGSVVIEEFPECLSDDLELQCLPQAKGITSHYTFKITSGSRCGNPCQLSRKSASRKVRPPELKEFRT